MRIVVLDGYTLNPGDLSWDKLKQMGDVHIFDRSNPAEILARAKDAEVVFTNKTVLSSEVLVQLPELKYIGVLATGYNVVDIAAAAAQKIIVSNIPAYGTDSVVQHTFALLLELCNHVKYHHDLVKNGRWSASKDFSFWDLPLTELAGKTMGIIGLGTIGRRVQEVANAFGMNVIVTGRTKPENLQVNWLTLDDLLSSADVVSIHCPLNPETQNLINADRISLMKRGAFLINTSRGPIINEPDLAEALNKGLIAGAALDVLSTEPPPSQNPLLQAKNCIITPHIAWATKEARQRMMDMAIENLNAYFTGNPIHVV